MVKYYKMIKKNISMFSIIKYGALLQKKKTA